MQEFRRPDWCAHLIETEKTLTGLSEHDLLLLATVLTSKELEGFQVLGKAHDQWRTFQTETSLHKPLKLDRGIRCPDPTKAKSSAVPQRAAPVPQQTQTETQEIGSSAQVTSTVKTPTMNSASQGPAKVQGPSGNPAKAEVIIQSNESLQWKAKVAKVKWPVLTFAKEIEISFQLLNVSAWIQGQKYNLILGRNSGDALDPRQALVMPSPEANLFRQHLNTLRKSPPSGAGQSR